MRGGLRAHRALTSAIGPILAICCAITGLSGCTAGPSGTKTPQADRPAADPGPAPVVMIVGDSFTVGSGPVPRWETYAALAAKRLGWQLITAGAGGTGFVNKGRVGRDFRESFERELSWRPAPDMVILSGGHNDRRVTPERVHDAASRTIAAVRATWPRTRIVVVGPIWLRRAPDWAYDVRDAIAAAAEKSKATFLDPLAQPMVAGPVKTSVLPDGVHPTHSGHAHLANWLVTALGGSAD
ncbi:lysophospholipase L1-like esterase [Thermocatellispora tengchongensis]|uniref:Lysophospholipase L1-like esterase n=1 Tax=Thermocatellispora tengchongensis TaxID=1073253 RepID=A0A840PLF8_9ACTN|nr:SGNH/GDSL hydrolase family protein [Thermocatellispora tengchongensis]MBB5138803.1 lysophospholipase L1-like esterase [Thermocatellispora tengchongensis]